MFDIIGTQFQRGIFELQLEKRGPSFLRAIAQLGPIRGRFLALVLIVAGSLLTVLEQPARLILEQGWAGSAAAAQIQALLKWILVLGGVGLYLLIFFYRQERMEIEFDRNSGAFRWFRVPQSARAAPEEGEVPFKAIESLEVLSPEQIPESPHGLMRIRLRATPLLKDSSQIEIRFLSEDQRKIFPTNIYYISEIRPRGAWKEPDEELARPEERE